MKSKKAKKKYYAGGSASPAEALGKLRDAKKGIAVGSYLEGGRIAYGDDKKKKKKKKSPMPGTISNVDLDKAGKQFGKYWSQFKTIMKTPIIK